jgi:predicted nucleotidyltransferase
MSAVKIMRIDSKEKIAGISILTIRKLLRRTNGLDSWPESEIIRVLKLDADRAAQVRDALIEKKLIESTKGYSDDEAYFCNTLDGNALAVASAAKPVSRDVAEKAFQEFMERVRTVNADPYYIYKVAKVILFGSFLGDSDVVGDVDIALDLAAKEKDTETFGEQLDQRRAEAIAKGRRFKTFVDEVTWPQDEVWLFLKSKSRVLSFHFPEDPILKQVEYKVVFEDGND